MIHPNEHWLNSWEKQLAIEAMLRYGILKWSNARDLPLKSGGTTDIYVNMRQARNHPEAIRFFSNMFCNPIQRLGAHRFAEVPQAVSCFAGLMADQLDISMVTIRDTVKTGRVSAADIIGDIKYDELIALFDDVITDGASKIPGYRAITKRGAMPVLIVGVDRQQGWQQTFMDEGVDMSVWAGMTLHDIRAYLIQNGFMERCDPEVERTNPIILALDGKSWDEILPVVDQLRTTGTILKVNDLAMGMGVDTIVPMLQVYGRVMVDLKAHDIPNTVDNICRRVAVHEPWACTFHGSGGSEMAKAVLDAFAGTNTIPLAITVLTSIDKETGEEIYRRRPISQVEKIVEMMWEVGVRGFVCSPKEVTMLRKKYPEATLVTPGVRSPSTERNDQSRTDTPKAAIKNGADFIVGGRQFFAAADPVAEVMRVLSEELRLT